MSSTQEILPVAGNRQVRAYGRGVLVTGRRELAVVVGLYAAATAAGLVAPRLLGAIVSGVQHGTSAGRIDLLTALIAASLVVQSVLIRFGALAGTRFGEGLLARLREDFVERVLALPLSVVERAGSGDLLSRSSRDVAALSQAARYGLPATLTAALAAVLTLGALGLDSAWLLLPCLLVVIPVSLALRWYLRRATAAYLRESAAWAQMTESLAETTEGARAVEALRLGPSRRRQATADMRDSYAAQRYTMRLRTVFLPAAEASYVLPVAGTLAFGGYLYLHGLCTLGQVTAGALYATALVRPIDELIQWLDHLQTAGAALARLLGIALVTPDREPAQDRPAGQELVADSVTHSYRAGGRDVLSSVSLRVRPGERIAIVGPSGAGKSTLGRLLAGITPPSAGRVMLGGVTLTRLPLADLRTRVALVSQEHHIFRGTLRDNVTLGRLDAADDQVLAALAAVEAAGWVSGLPGGLGCVVGSGGVALSAARAQQVALARLLLADPHTLILDEATALLDPRSARRLERSMAAVLDGRTVVSIAHRLHVGHDADRVIVLEEGEIRETGTHRELIAAGGAYAALWRSWHGTARPAAAGEEGHAEAAGRH